jgi:hypothetical protein
MSGQLHALATLFLYKGPQVLGEEETGETTEIVWLNSDENYIQEALGRHSFAWVGFDYMRLNVTK